MKPTYGSQYHCTACRTTKQTPMFSCHTLVDSIPSFSSGPFCFGKLSGKKTSKSMFVIFRTLSGVKIYIRTAFSLVCANTTTMFTPDKKLCSLFVLQMERKNAKGPFPPHHSTGKFRCRRSPQNGQTYDCC